MITLLSVARELKAQGVLGLNKRNGDYIMALNPRRLYPLVDDKLKTKQLALAAGIAVPELYGVLETQHDVSRLSEIVAGRPEFVLKPATGSGGDGIVVISGRSGASFRTISGYLIDEGEMAHHLSNALNGQYSLGGVQDKVIVEYCVKFDPLFEQISYLGIPDIRIIVVRGYPVMAMVRLPTRRSSGKANLHQGAVGAGIDIATGRTLHGSSGYTVVREHPDTGRPIAGLQIPNWKAMLALASRCYEVTALGYVGVDIVLDRDLGPLILELNARPGLNIQIANRVGLLSRLRVVDREPHGAPLEERVQFAVENFAGAGL